MNKYLKIGLSVVLITSIGLYVNMTKDNQKSKINPKSSIEKIDPTNKNIEKKEQFTSKQDIKKLQYSKVAFPKNVRKIEHDLIDIQNSIIQEKAKLDSEAKLSNKEVDRKIEETNELIAKLNEELNIAPQKVEEIENSYVVVLNTQPTTVKSRKIDKKLFKIDEDLLKLEGEFEKLQTGGLK